MGHGSFVDTAGYRFEVILGHRMDCLCQRFFRFSFLDAFYTFRAFRRFSVGAR